MMREYYIQWHITNRCNMRCLHCYNSNFTKRGELGRVKLKKVYAEVINALDKWNAKGIINITGGEPLIKKELFDILDYLNKAKQIKDLTIISNLTLINPEILKRLAQFKKLKTIKFSLEGLTSKSNDSIRIDGAFKRILAALELINSSRRFKSILMFTVLKHNVNQVRGILNFCREFEIAGFIVERFIPLGQSKDKTQYVIDSNDYKKMIKDLLEICQLDCDVEDLANFRAFLVKIKNKKPHLFGASCTIANDGCCIMPNADVYPCRRFGKSIGNILKNNFVDIVERSDMLRDMKTKSKLKGRCAVCGIKDCRGCRALCYSLTADYLAQDSQCWL